MVNDFMWDLKANTKDNPNAYLEMNHNFYGGELNNITCISAELDINGFSSCKALFEVPLNYENFKISYRGDSLVEWMYQGEK